MRGKTKLQLRSPVMKSVVLWNKVLKVIKPEAYIFKLILFFKSILRFKRRSADVPSLRAPEEPHLNTIWISSASQTM